MLDDHGDEFDFDVDDGVGAVTSDKFVFGITPVNDAPTLADHTVSMFTGDTLVAPASLFDALSDDVDGCVRRGARLMSAIEGMRVRDNDVTVRD